MSWFHEAREKYVHISSKELREYAQDPKKRNNQRIEKHLEKCRFCHDEFIGFLQAAYFEKIGEPPKNDAKKFIQQLKRKELE